MSVSLASCRESCLILSEIHSSKAIAWRFRKHLAEQIGALSRLFSAPSTFSVVVPLTFDLLGDSIAAVRESVFPCMWPLLKRLGDSDSKWRDDISSKIVSFATGDTFSAREKYIYICDAMLGDETVDRTFFNATFVTPLLGIANDGTANVRVVLGRCWTPEWFKAGKEYAEVMKKLRGDSDRDVAMRLDFPKQSGSARLVARAGRRQSGSTCASDLQRKRQGKKQFQRLGRWWGWSRRGWHRAPGSRRIKKIMLFSILAAV